MKLQEKTITVQGITTHYLTAGENGDCLLLLHGGGADSATLSWGDVILPLAEAGYRVFAPDLPGYGLSDRPNIACNTDALLGFVNAFIDAVGIDHPLSLMGLSMGGGISLSLTLANPKMVRRLILVDSYGLQRKVAMHFLSWLVVKLPFMMESSWVMMRNNRSMARYAMRGVFHDVNLISDPLMDELMAEAKRPHAGRAFTRYQRNEVFINGLRTVYIDQLHEIKAQTLILHGEKDIAVPLACAKEAHERIPGATLALIPDAGHWPQRENPTTFLNAVIGFLKGSCSLG